MKRVVATALITVALAACGTDQQQGDLALGLDEQDACPNPSWYCASLGLQLLGAMDSCTYGGRYYGENSGGEYLSWDVTCTSSAHPGTWTAVHDGYWSQNAYYFRKLDVGSCSVSDSLCYDDYPYCQGGLIYTANVGIPRAATGARSSSRPTSPGLRAGAPSGRTTSSTRRPALPPGSAASCTTCP